MGAGKYIQIEGKKERKEGRSAENNKKEWIKN
jgi:hypothetical protein